MRLHYLLLVLFICSLGSCSPWKKMQISNGNQNDAIKNAVIDFLYSPKFFKGDSVFIISIKNINEDILAVSIFGARNKIAVITENEIDYSYRGFPTKYFEQDGKLFYWQDSTEKVPIELIDKLSKMNRIDTSIIAKFIPLRTTDDSQKAVDYYFCKYNLKKYKRIYTKIGIGWYDPPKINCKH